MIAYGLLAPRASALPQQVIYDPQTGTYSMAQPIFASQRVALPDAGPMYYQGAPVAPQYVQGVQGVQYGPPAGYRQVAYTTPAEYGAPQAPAVRTSQTAAAPRRVSTTRVVDGRGRNWKKTALVIGGSTATAAGIGGLIGGKKGALIGAAIGGGASTLYESKQ